MRTVIICATDGEAHAMASRLEGVVLTDPTDIPHHQGVCCMAAASLTGDAALHLDRSTGSTVLFSVGYLLAAARVA